MKRVTLFRIITVVMILLNIVSVYLVWKVIDNQLPDMVLLLKLVMLFIIGTYITYGYFSMTLVFIRKIKREDIIDMIERKHNNDRENNNYSTTTNEQRKK